MQQKLEGDICSFSDTRLERNHVSTETMTRFAMTDFIDDGLLCTVIFYHIQYCTSRWNWEKLSAEQPLLGQAVRLVRPSNTV